MDLIFLLTGSEITNLPCLWISSVGSLSLSCALHPFGILAKSVYPFSEKCFQIYKIQRITKETNYIEMQLESIKHKFVM